MSLLPVVGFKCPVCSKFVPSDEMDLHLVLCLTKPRVTYNGKSYFFSHLIDYQFPHGIITPSIIMSSEPLCKKTKKKQKRIKSQIRSHRYNFGF